MSGSGTDSGSKARPQIHQATLHGPVLDGQGHADHVGFPLRIGIADDVRQQFFNREGHIEAGRAVVGNAVEECADRVKDARNFRQAVGQVDHQFRRQGSCVSLEPVAIVGAIRPVAQDVAAVFPPAVGGAASRRRDRRCRLSS